MRTIAVVEGKAYIATAGHERATFVDVGATRYNLDPGGYRRLIIPFGILEATLGDDRVTLEPAALQPGETAEDMEVGLR